MFESNNIKLSANYNLIWTNMKERVIQAFIELYGKEYENKIRNVINDIKFVHVAKEDKDTLEDKFFQLYDAIKKSFIYYNVLSENTPVKDVLAYSTKYVNAQVLSYYIDCNYDSFDQLTDKIIECGFYYAAARNKEVVTYGNPTGSIVITFNGYNIPLEEMFSTINSRFCYINPSDTLLGVFNNLFARELTENFYALSNSVESIITKGNIKRYLYIYDALCNDDKSIIGNMFSFYHDYLKQLFINNKYTDFVFFFEENQYNKINSYLNDCIEKIAMEIYRNPYVNIQNVLTIEEKNKGVSLLNDIYSRLSLRKLQKITN